MISDAVPTTQTISFWVTEESTAIFNVSFFDETGAPALGSSITWTLSDDAGSIINNRSNVSIPGSASAIIVSLTNLDTKRELPRPSDGQPDDCVRWLKVVCFYNSINGSGFKLVATYVFGILPIPAE